MTLLLHVPEKKKKLIEAALKLMLAKGYYATTIDEICMEANVTKGSYFHYFKSKEDIAKASIQFFSEFQLSVFQDAPYHAEKDALRKLNMFFDHYLNIADNPDFPKSCLASTFIQELSDEMPDIRVMCEQNYDANANLLEEVLLQCQQQYSTASHFDAKQTSLLFTSLYQGSLLYSRAKQDTTIIKQNIAQFRQYLIHFFN